MRKTPLAVLARAAAAALLAVSAGAVELKSPVGGPEGAAMPPAAVPASGVVGPLDTPSLSVPQAPETGIPALPPSAVAPEAGAAAPSAEAVPAAAGDAARVLPGASAAAAADASSIPQAPASAGAAKAAPGPVAPAASPEARQAPTARAQAASAGTPSGLDGDSSESAAAASGAAFDGSREDSRASGPTLAVERHDGQPHLHSYQAGETPSADMRRRPPQPFPIPDRFKDLVPSARNPASWTGLITLHLHSVYSDGTMEPEALVQLAYDKGVRELAVSEHDTTASTLRAWKKASELGMIYHPAVEFSANGGVHIGGVDIDISNPRVVALLARVRAARYQRAKEIVDYLNGPQIVEALKKLSDKPEDKWGPGADGQWGKTTLPPGHNSASEALRRLLDFRARGGSIKLDDVVAQSRYAEGGTIEVPHIARVLLADGLIDSVDAAYDAFLKGDPGGGPSSASADPSPDEIISVIHAAGGKAILNHPYTVHGRTPQESEARAYAILQQGMDGIETYRPIKATSQAGKNRADERAAKYLTWAEQLNLFSAPGADFHGTDTHLDTIQVWMPKTLAGVLQDRLKDSHAAAIAALERLDKAAAQPPSPAAGAAPALLALPLAASAPLTLDHFPWIALLPAGLLLAFAVVGTSPWFKRFEVKHAVLADLLLLALAAGFAVTSFGLMFRFWT